MCPCNEHTNWARVTLWGAKYEFCHTNVKFEFWVELCYFIIDNGYNATYLPCTAEVHKDVSGQFHNAICCGDVEERIKVLRSVGQGT